MTNKWNSWEEQLKDLNGFVARTMHHHNCTIAQLHMNECCKHRNMISVAKVQYRQELNGVGRTFLNVDHLNSKSDNKYINRNTNI